MPQSNSRIGVVVPAILAGALALLQPGIDPVFLSLLSKAHALDPTLHGWIVSATQAGLAAGSLLSLLAGSRLPPYTFALAALLALAAALGTALSGEFATLVVLRAAFGLATGLIYTQALAHAARHRPTAAFAATFLLQLLLSMIAAIALPALAESFDARLALVGLALVPGALLAILLLVPDPIGTHCEWSRAAQDASVRRAEPAGSGFSLQIALLAGAILGYVCATMMVWSMTGSMALAAGFSNATIGNAVSIGSLAGAVTALALFAERIRVSPKLTAVLCGLSLMAPVFATIHGHPLLFILGIIAFNIGSTAIVIRCSGFAASACRSTRDLRFVSCLQTLGMIAGPAIGSLSTMAASPGGPLLPAGAAIALACSALTIWHARERAMGTRFQPAAHLLEQPQAA
ncbi:MFS transporter [Novosphingobium profundi]|uniref:MFS transporter n=1 Tax=Novosphingobium profundi TaxID=1774954 RepID=UPI001BD9A223|nr:MFS transporter [Novosphingobium profundi]MBT0667466.1 MFS transporter [Novosphingobium profundi]